MSADDIVAIIWAAVGAVTTIILVLFMVKDLFD